MSTNRADLHIHTTFSDGLLEPEDAVNYAVTNTNLRVICITDHNTLDGAHMAHDYWHAHRQDFSQIELVIGEEITSTKGHILGLFLHETIPPHMTPADTVAAIHAQGGIAIAAHPFTHLLFFSDLHGIGREIGELPLDAVEVRNSVPSEIYSNVLTAWFNARHRKHTAVGGSDCHYLPMLGRTYTWFDGTTAAELKTALQTHAARPGGVVNGPFTVAQFVRDMLRRKKLPFVMPNDHVYRNTAMDLQVEIQELRHVPAAILHCTGKIVRPNVEALNAQVMRLLDGGITHLIFDLSQVSFVDSAGLGTFVAAQKRARTHQGDVSLCGASEGVALTLRLVRLDKVFHMHKQPSEAVALLMHA